MYPYTSAEGGIETRTKERRKLFKKNRRTGLEMRGQDEPEYQPNSEKPGKRVNARSLKDAEIYGSCA